jgi:hypothetical protein
MRGKELRGAFALAWVGGSAAPQMVGSRPIRPILAKAAVLESGRQAADAPIIGPTFCGWGFLCRAPTRE